MSGVGTSENSTLNIGPKKQDKQRPETKFKSKTGSTKATAHTSSNNLTRFNGENTIMVRKFVDSAIVGKSVAEMSCHNGLVEPTITTKEAMHAINNMFQEPLDLDPAIQRKSHKRNNPQNNDNSGFEIFVDEEERLCKSNKNPGNIKPFVGDFTILPDEEEPQNLNRNLKNINHGLREDTVIIRKFVGSAVSEEPKVENACHHGLVEPTMNLKEAMDEINGMFRKPMDMGEKLKRRQKVPLGENKPTVGSSFSILPDDELEENINPTHKPNNFSDSSFSILPDDELEENTNPTSKPNNILKSKNPKMGKSGSGYTPVNGTGSSKAVTEVKSNPTCKKVEGGGRCDDLFEPTFFTRQAMDDINEMFGKDIDF